MKPRFNKGDILVNPRFPGVERRIERVRKKGYSWSYPQYEFEAMTPGGSQNHWWSENSSDPLFEIDWYVKGSTIEPKHIRLKAHAMLSQELISQSEFSEIVSIQDLNVADEQPNELYKSRLK